MNNFSILYYKLLVANTTFFPKTFIYVLNHGKFCIFLKTPSSNSDSVCNISANDFMSEGCARHDKMIHSDCGLQGSGDCSMEGTADNTRPEAFLPAAAGAGATRTREATGTGRRTLWRISMPGWPP